MPDLTSLKSSSSGSNIPGGPEGRPSGAERRTSPNLIQKMLAGDPDFRGIGKATAAKLTEVFGEGLHAALAGADQRVEEIIGVELAADLFVVYRTKLSEMDVVAWLSELDVDTRVAMKIVRVWGAEGAANLRRNPFLLISFISWKQVETIGRKLGIAHSDPRRLVAAVENELFRRLDDKHTFTPRPILQQSVGKCLGHPKDARKAMDLAVDALGAIRFEHGYQPPGAAAMEAFVANAFLGLAKEEAQADLVARDVEPDEVRIALDAFDASQPYPLTDKQREAVAMAVRNRIGFLGGYAGSGKTSVLKAIAQTAEQFGRVVHFMALSGRAAKRISETTGRRASTIASFLKRVTEKKDLNLGPEVMIVIDEASMIDLPTLYRIMRHIGQARLLMVGDPAQLPPIGFGLTFHVLIDHPKMPHVMLDRVMRQSVASGIPAVADAIRHGRMPIVENFEGLKGGVSFVSCSGSQAFETIVEIGRQLAMEGMKRGQCQIIAPVRAGPGGIDALNLRFHNLLSAGRPPYPGRSGIGEGDPIIWTKNDWQRDLQNGSTGRLLKIGPDGILAELDGRQIRLEIDDNEMIDLAYAISVHKAQGSQWDRVIVPIFPSKILDRTLLYTAVTRAANQVVFVGDRGEFERSIVEAPQVDRRETTLPMRLNKPKKEIGYAVT